MLAAGAEHEQAAGRADCGAGARARAARVGAGGQGDRGGRRRGARGWRATPLAARLPVLRNAVVDRLITQFSRQNGVVGVAVFLPGADLPVLTLNQIRMLMRIADAYGFELDRERIPEVLGVIGSGVGFRAAARSLLGVIPVAGWAVKGGIAYAGTRTLGEAARRYFESRAPVTRVAGERAVF